MATGFASNACLRQFSVFGWRADSILLAVSALEHLGVGADSETNVLLQQCGPQVIELEKAPNGHHCVVLVDDLLSRDVTCLDNVTPIPFVERILEVAARSVDNICGQLPTVVTSAATGRVERGSQARKS